MKTIREDGMGVSALGSTVPKNNISSGEIKLFDPLLGDNGVLKRTILQSLERKEKSQMETKLQEITKEIIGLKTDLAQIDVLVEKLDVTIDKLSEVSHSISELIAVHGSRLEMQEKLIAEIFNKIDKRAQEANDNLRYLKNELTQTEKEIHDKINDHVDQIEKIQSKLINDCEHKHEKVNEKIKFYEKWVWITIGIVAAISILSNGSLSILKYLK